MAWNCVCVACAHWLSTTCKKSLHRAPAPFHMPQDLGKPPWCQSAAPSNVKSSSSYGVPLQSPSLKSVLGGTAHPRSQIPAQRWGAPWMETRSAHSLLMTLSEGGGSLPGISREIWVIDNTHIYSLTAKLSYIFFRESIINKRNFSKFFFF